MLLHNLLPIAVFTALVLMVTPAVAAKPAKAKPQAPAPAEKAPAATKGEPAPAKTPAPDPKAQPLRADATLAKLIATIDKALAAGPPKDAQSPDPGGSLLQALARSSVIAVLHGHFAIASSGHALRTGGIPATEVAVTAKTMATNYEALGQVYTEVAGHKQFAGDLADIFRVVALLCGYAKTASDALGHFAAAPNDLSRAKTFEDAVENYRTRLAAFFAHLEAGASKGG
ncbi:MAG: hypothetical protein EXR77_07205 [Myxococcales bacterium]|nr:hypothetical protein [Myxococcales bacterium]